MEGTRAWHLEHFKCCECKKLIDSTGFHDKDEKIYCTDCFGRLFLPVCPVCKTYVDGVLMNGKFHQKCFKNALLQTVVFLAILPTGNDLNKQTTNF